jgi:DnaJ-like protein C11, C-terminal
MRFRSAMCIIVGLACVLLLPGSALAQGGELVGAEWGVPGSSVDVTARVRAFVHDGVLQFEVTRFNLGIDPAPHQNKILLIRVRHWDGDVKEYSYPERSTVNLELDPEDRWERREEREQHGQEERHDERFEHRERGLRILRAYYGAEGQFMNVTDALRSRVDDGQLFVHVDNYNMGGDPLPGVHKWLRVLYMYEGQRQNVVVDEKTELRLP